MLQVGNRFVGAALAGARVVPRGCGGGDPDRAEPEAAAFLVTVTGNLIGNPPPGATFTVTSTVKMVGAF